MPLAPASSTAPPYARPHHLPAARADCKRGRSKCTRCISGSGKLNGKCVDCIKFDKNCSSCDKVGGRGLERFGFGGDITRTSLFGVC